MDSKESDQNPIGLMRGGGKYEQKNAQYCNLTTPLHKYLRTKTTALSYSQTMPLQAQTDFEKPETPHIKSDHFNTS